MAKKKKRRSRQLTVPLSMVAGFTPLIASGVRGWQAETFRGAGKEMLYGLTGYDIDTHQFNQAFMWNGTYPILLGTIIHKVAGRLGVNRMIAATGIPFLRI